MPQLAMLMCLFATALYGCGIQPVNSTEQPPVYGGTDANPPADAMPYGEGILDAVESTALLNLAFPQFYDAVKNRLGFPAYRTDTADYYQLTDILAASKKWTFRFSCSMSGMMQLSTS